MNCTPAVGMDPSKFTYGHDSALAPTVLPSASDFGNFADNDDWKPFENTVLTAAPTTSEFDDDDFGDFASSEVPGKYINYDYK